MRSLIYCCVAMLVSAPAHANQPIPGCGFRYWGGNVNIAAAKGYKVVTVQPEYQMIQVYGEVRAQYRTERRPAWDGGPMETVRTEVRPASTSLVQRKMIRPAYFLIKDKDDKQVARFEKPADVQTYVCGVLIPLLRE